PSLSPHCGARRVLPSCPTRRSSDLDHFIRRPDGAGRAAALSEDEVEARAAFVRLASLLGGVPTDLEAAEGYLTYYEEVTNRPGVLDSAAALLDRASRTTPLPRLAPALVRLLFLRGDYAAVRVVAREVDAEAVDDAWTQYRIGEAFAATGASEAALRPFRRAVALAPHALRF